MSFTSPFPDVEIPPEVSVHEFLLGTIADDELGRTALVDPKSGAVTSYKELITQIDAVAGWLASRGDRCRGRGGHPLAQHSGVRDGVPRHLACRWHGDDGQCVVHGT